MTQNKVSFAVEIDGKTVELAVVRPSVKVQQDAQVAYSKAFADFTRAGAIFKSVLYNHAREQRLWDDAKQAEFVALTTRMLADEKAVEGKVRGTTFAQARDAALRLRRDRHALQVLLRDRAVLEANTVEGQAENMRFNHFVAACTVHADTKKPYYRDVEDYLGRADDPVGPAAAAHFAALYYGHDPQAEKNLPESQFLLKYRLCDERLRLVKVVGGVERLVDADGRLVDEDGRFVNEAGELVDADGNRVDEAGRPTDAETFPFLDDDGQPVGVPTTAAA